MQSKALPLTVADLLRKQAVVRRDAPALQDAQGALSFGQLDGWACRIAQALLAGGVGAGDRIAVLAENRREYIGLQLAAAKIGAIVACLNWRLADGEVAHCLGLVSPRLVFVSRRHADVLARIGWADCPVIGLDAEFDGFLSGRSEADPQPDVDAEQGLVILYTSGTTGLPKGAVISQRAMVARAMCFAADYGISAEHAYVAWSPLFHMAATDFSLATLMLGGKVVVQDGLDIDRLCATIERETIGWLVAMPGMIDLLIEGLKRHRTRPRGVRLVGAMADLVPLQQIAELTGLLGAPYINSFGATETGLAPASGALLAPGVVPTSLAKRESGFCRVRLVDADDRDVPPGTPGEAALRGPTLFSGYWNAPEVNAHDFRGGWFHMGDLFVRRADGSLDFVDRAKYLIKSGGENIYPAEIERVLLAQPAVADAVVVRRRDGRWGEVPVAFVAVQPGAAADGEPLLSRCRERLAGYKVPKEIRFVDMAAFPRSSTGKIQRHEVERQWLAE
ncbi:class I adenylate-forming enzyme family protein [Piscinibacter koreensis]|uniref:AMP-binding protein n=1 Tax=Piscinibacter koreensis TaxID=2742824 RepID=A0A7Y6NQJ8_9BURK|nr:AMP-binding protein [Schlegelella koreensis]NUZ07495.1 AMP-binding protein [Schlegelella koreensis]